MPRDVSLSDSKCWNGGHEWDKSTIVVLQAISHGRAYTYDVCVSVIRDIIFSFIILCIVQIQICILLSWTKDRNLFHSFWESLYNPTVGWAKLCGIFVCFFFSLLSTIHFMCIRIFNNCRRKFSKILLISV